MAAIKAMEGVEVYFDGRPLRESIDDLLGPELKEDIGDTTDEEHELGVSPQAPADRRLLGQGQAT